MRWAVPAPNFARRFALALIPALAVSAAMSGGARAAEPPAVSAELIRLHDDLHLTPAQESAWMDYARAIAPNPELQARRRAADALFPTLPTPRRIALIEATMAADAADFRKVGDAVNAFYGRLTSEQQRTFDAETAPSGGPSAAGRQPD